MRFWRRRDEVRDLVFDHLPCVSTALNASEEATRSYFVSGDREKAAGFALETRRAEGNADDIRRTVEKAMITGALLPPSRRQILEVVERADTLANAAEASLGSLLLQQVGVPEVLVPSILEILEESLAIFKEVECCIQSLFEGRPEEALQCADRIEQAEGRVDQMERETLKQLFSMDIDLAEKLHVSGYVADLVKISDRGEDLADRVALIVAERAY